MSNPHPMPRNQSEHGAIATKAVDELTDATEGPTSCRYGSAADTTEWYARQPLCPLATKAKECHDAKKQPFHSIYGIPPPEKWDAEKKMPFYSFWFDKRSQIRIGFSENRLFDDTKKRISMQQMFLQRNACPFAFLGKKQLIYLYRALMRVSMVDMTSS